MYVFIEFTVCQFIRGPLSEGVAKGKDCMLTSYLCL